MSNISYVVIGDTRRKDRAVDLAHKLNASLALDTDGRWGPTVNHRRGWTLGNTEKCDWVVVIEDDAILCDNFLDNARDALDNAPTPLVSFYLGTSYPAHLVCKAEQMLEKAENEGDDWLQLDTLNHAVCVALRVPLVDSMLDYVAERRRPIDEAITEWAQSMRVKVSYPVISLVNHLDDETIIAQNQRSDRVKRDKPRKAFRFLG